MEDSPDLTFPLKAPDDYWRPEWNSRFKGQKYAIYTLVDLGEDGPAALEDAINAPEICRGTSALAPKHNFAGGPLRSVYDYHLELVKGDIFHPRSFIVAVNRDFHKHGVVLVMFNCDYEGTIGIGRCKVDRAASWFMNFDIGNMDWEDLKEEENDLDEPIQSLQQQHREDEQIHGGQQSDASEPKWLYGIYTTAGANMTEIRGLLEPNWLNMRLEQYRCEFAGNYTGAPDPQMEMRKWHPWNCWRNRSLHRQLVICADEQDVKQEGVLLLRFNWDGDIDDAGDPSNLLRLEPRYEILKRSSVGQAVADLDDIAKS